MTKIAALTIANAMVFQEVLAASDGRVEPLRSSLSADEPITTLAEHWSFIEGTIDYVPIFSVARRLLLALPADERVEEAVHALGQRALEIVSRKAALRHDLMGRVYHRLLSEAKYLGTYYTSVPAATLLLKFALDPERWDIDWSDLEKVDNFHVADLACGTGTLLMATAEAIADNHVRSAVRSGRAPDLVALHKLLMESVLTGFDVLASALHLTASTLALRASAVAFDRTDLYAVPLGGPDHRLGSLELLVTRDIGISEDLFGNPATRAEQVTGGGDELVVDKHVDDVDLCVMNPPFTRSVGGNLLFGSLPSAERAPMRARLTRVMRESAAKASAVAGLGSVFVAAGDRVLKRGGTMALVLPKALLSGVAWQTSRNLLSDQYVVELLVASHDPEKWNFSDNTDLSEVLVVARKLRPNESWRDASVTALNLHRNPRTAVEALEAAQQLLGHEVPDVETGQGSLEISSGSLKVGEAVRLPWAALRHGLWMLPCAFAQSDIIRAAHWLMNGAVAIPGAPERTCVKLCYLKDLGALGPDRRDIWDGFDFSDTPTTYAALWGAAAAGATGLTQQPNQYLTPLGAARPGRSLRRVELLWPRAGRVVLAEGLRLNTQGIVAGYVGQKVLSNVWWPLAFHVENERAEKALVLWLNSTLGLIMLLAHREETEGAWVGWKKPVLEGMPVLDVTTLSDRKLDILEAAFNELHEEALAPFPSMAEDTVRAAIDEAVMSALELPDVAPLRFMLAREPVVCEQPMYESTS